MKDKLNEHEIYRLTEGVGEWRQAHFGCYYLFGNIENIGVELKYHLSLFGKEISDVSAVINCIPDMSRVNNISYRYNLIGNNLGEISWTKDSKLKEIVVKARGDCRRRVKKENNLAVSMARDTLERVLGRGK